MHDNTLVPHSRRIWPKRALFVAIILALAAGILVSRISGVPNTIYVDGSPLVTVNSARAAKAVMQKVRLQRADGVTNGYVRFAQLVTLRQAKEGSSISDIPEAARILDKVVTVEADLYAIVVDDKPLAALANMNDAEETLNLAKSYYEKKLRHLCAESTFKENVYIRKHYVEAEKFCPSPQEAVRILTSVADKPVIHVIQRGDRAMKIAAQYGISFNELKRLNIDLNLERLTEGDQLMIRRPKLPITVLCKALVTKTEQLNPPNELGRYRRTQGGKRQLRMLVTYENGQPASEEILSQVTTWDRPKGRAQDDEYDGRKSRRYRHYRHRRSE